MEVAVDVFVQLKIEAKGSQQRQNSITYAQMMAIPRRIHIGDFLTLLNLMINAFRFGRFRSYLRNVWIWWRWVYFAFLGISSLLFLCFRSLSISWALLYISLCATDFECYMDNHQRHFLSSYSIYICSSLICSNK